MTGALRGSAAQLRSQFVSEMIYRNHLNQPLVGLLHNALPIDLKVCRLSLQHQNRSAARCAGGAFNPGGALLFFTRWNGSGRSFRQRLRFRGSGAPQLRCDAITRPQLCASDRPDKLAAHWLFRLRLRQRLIADFGWWALSECG
jgi:hypothetical protein